MESRRWIRSGVVERVDAREDRFEAVADVCQDPVQSGKSEPRLVAFEQHGVRVPLRVDALGQASFHGDDALQLGSEEREVVLATGFDPHGARMRV